ncbi:DNA translocase FtsK [candidate division KSB1 bacterium]|nr:DNA translocase FtsK [candidate division KSB1 bacterium]
MAGKSAKLSQRQREEILGILLMMLGTLVLVSLISYDSRDEFQGFGTRAIYNAIGLAGVGISKVLIQILFGYPAILIPFVIMAWGWFYFRGHKRDKLSRITFYALFAALYLAAWLGLPQAMNQSSEFGYAYSGVVGGFISHSLHGIFGAIGSVIVMLAIGAVALMIATQMSLHEAILKAMQGVGRLREFFSGGWSSLRHWRPALPEFGAEEPSAKSWRTVEPDLEEAAEEEVHVVDEPMEPRWKKLARLRTLEDSNSSSVIPGAARREFTEPGLPANAAPMNSAYEKIAPDGARSQKSESFADSPRAAETDKPRPPGNYVFPSLELLSVPPVDQQKVQSRDELLSLARVLEERLLEFDVEGKVVEINPGPVITRYEYEPAPGIKVSRITALADDLAHRLNAIEDNPERTHLATRFGNGDIDGFGMAIETDEA